MTFLNAPVDLADIPRVDTLQLTPIERSYLKVIRIQSLLVVLITGGIIAPILIFAKKLHNPIVISIVIGVWVLIMLLMLIAQTKSFHIRGYAIRERDIIYRSGWIFRQTEVCPINRIQHSVVTVGPIERQFKLATLVLHTAGAQGADMKIAGLKESMALDLKEWITKKIADEPAD